MIFFLFFRYGFYFPLIETETVHREIEAQSGREQSKKDKKKKNETMDAESCDGTIEMVKRNRDHHHRHYHGGGDRQLTRSSTSPCWIEIAIHKKLELIKDGRDGISDVIVNDGWATAGMMTVVVDSGGSDDRWQFFAVGGNQPAQRLGPLLVGPFVNGVCRVINHQSINQSIDQSKGKEKIKVDSSCWQEQPF